MRIIILGGSGGSGQACAREFLRLGHEVVIFGRDHGKLVSLANRWENPSGLSVTAGDVYSAESMIPAFSESDIVIQAANPGYLGIVEYLPKLCDAVLDAAEATAKKVVFLEGVYTYGRNPGHPVAEDFPGKPHTRKGRTKHACAERILSPNWKHLSAMIIRMPDYYGPTSQMAFLDSTLSALASRKFGIFIGTKKPRREYLYLPDAAERIARLVLDENAYGQVWNLSGIHLSGEEILKICREHLGYKSPVWGLGPRSIRFLGVFVPFFRELSEMTYLLDDPLILDGGKYERAYGKPTDTEPRIGFAATLEALKERTLQ